MHHISIVCTESDWPIDLGNQNHWAAIGRDFILCSLFSERFYLQIFHWGTHRCLQSSRLVQEFHLCLITGLSSAITCINDQVVKCQVKDIMCYLNCKELKKKSVADVLLHRNKNINSHFKYIFRKLNIPNMHMYKLSNLNFDVTRVAYCLFRLTDIKLSDEII